MAPTQNANLEYFRNAAQRSLALAQSHPALAIRILEGHGQADITSAEGDVLHNYMARGFVLESMGRGSKRVRECSFLA